MRNIYKILLLTFLLFSCKNSTNKSEHSASNDSVFFMNKLIEIHSNSIQAETRDIGIIRLDSLIQVLEKSDLKYPLIMAYISYSAQGDSLKVVSNLAKADKIVASTKDTVLMAMNYHLKSKYYHIYSQRDKAFENALLANELSRNRNDPTYDNSLSILSDIATESGNYDVAVSYSNEILQRGKERNIKPIYTVEDYLALAIIHARQDEFLKTEKYKDSADYIIKKNNFKNIYLYNLVEGYINFSKKNYQAAIDNFNNELELLGDYNLIFIKKAEAFDKLNMKDSIVKNLQLVEKSFNGVQQHYDYNEIREYFPIKLKYTNNENRDSIITLYSQFLDESLNENKTLIIQKYRHNINLNKLKKDKDQDTEKERRLRVIFLFIIIILILSIVTLAYRHANKKKEFELNYLNKVIETSNKERTRIAQELHDDLGSNFTSIIMAKQLYKLDKKEIEDPNLNIILNNIKEIFLKINEIVWSMDTQNNSLNDLVLYTNKFLRNFLQGQPITWKVDSSNKCKESHVLLPSYIRRQIFITIKEITNNTVKYANADSINIYFDITGDDLIIQISDDGVGFDINQNSKGKGVNNIKNLCQRIDNCKVKLHSNEFGTIYNILIKINNL